MLIIFESQNLKNLSVYFQYFRVRVATRLKDNTLKTVITVLYLTFHSSY